MFALNEAYSSPRKPEVSISSKVSPPAHCRLQRPFLFVKPKLTEWPPPVQPSLAVLRFLEAVVSALPGSLPYCYRGLLCAISGERSLSFLFLSSYFCYVAALAVEREAESVPTFRKSWEAKGGRWRSWRAPDWLGVVIGPGRISVAATFLRNIPRP